MRQRSAPGVKQGMNLCTAKLVHILGLSRGGGAGLAALVPRDCDYHSCWLGMQERVFDGQSFSRRGGVEFLIGGNQHHAETGVKPLLV